MTLQPLALQPLALRRGIPLVASLSIIAACGGPQDGGSGTDTDQPDTGSDTDTGTDTDAGTDAGTDATVEPQTTLNAVMQEWVGAFCTGMSACDPEYFGSAYGTVEDCGMMMLESYAEASAYYEDPVCNEAFAAYLDCAMHNSECAAYAYGEESYGEWGISEGSCVEEYAAMGMACPD